MVDALVSCDAAKLTEFVNAALEADVIANDILNSGLIAGMDIVGERMESGGSSLKSSWVPRLWADV